MGTATIQSIFSAAAVVAIMVVAPQTASAQSAGWLARAANAVREQLDTERPRVLRRSIELEDASLETLQTRLGWLGIELPLELRGDVTTRLGIEIDLAALRDARSYRITGALSSDRMVIEGLELRNVSASVRYVDGRMTLDQLVAVVPDSGPNRPAGRATGDATLQLLPVGALRATLRLDRVPLEPFHRRIDAAASLAGGRISGQVTVEAPISNLRDEKAWRGTGGVTVDDLIAAGRSMSRLETHAELADGTLAVTDLTAALEGERVTGSGTLELTPPFEYRVELDVPQGKLAQLEGLIQKELPESLSGDYVLSSDAHGTLRPFRMDMNGSLTGDGWSIGGVPVTSMRADLRSDGERIELTSFDARLREGRIVGQGRLNLDEDRKFSFRLNPERFDLAVLDPILHVAALDTEDRGQRVTVGFRAVQDESHDAEPRPADEGPAADAPQIDGTASGDIEVVGQSLPFRLDGLDGTLSFEDLVIAGVSFDRADVVAETQNRTLVLSRLLLVKGEGQLSGEGRIGLDAPNAYSLTLRPQQFSIDPTRPLFGEAAPAGLSLPPVSGRLDGTLAAAGELQPFRLDSLQGDLTGDDIRIGRLLVDRFEIAAATAERSITVSKLLVAIEDGRLTGQATLGLAGERPFEATLRPDRFRIELLRPLFGEGGVIETDFPPVAGRVSGEITLRGRAAPGAIDGVSGRVSTEQPIVSDVRFDRASLVVATENGRMQIQSFRAESDYGILSGTGTAGLAAPYHYSARLDFGDFDLSALGRITADLTEEQRPDLESPAEVAEGPGVLPVELEGLADVHGDVRGTLLPFVLAGEGTAGADRLRLDANDLNDIFRPTTLAAPRFDWKYDERRLTLDGIRAGLGAGTLSGTATVPLGDASTGAIDLRITNVEVSDLLELPGDVGGIATGGIVAEFGPADGEGERQANGRATLSIPVVRAGRITAGDVEAALSLDRDRVGYDVTGRLFDGALATRGTWPLDESGRKEAAGTFRWTGANLARIAAVAADPAPLSGTVDVAADYDLGRDGTKGTGTVQLRNVRSRDRLITDRLQARAVWTDSTIRIENAAGGYAGGTVSFAVELNALDPGRGSVEITLRRADAQRAVGWIPGLEPLEGTLDGRLKGSLRRLWHWQGEVEITRGSYGPLAFSSWRVPIDIDANPLRGAVKVELRRTSIRAAHGRASLNLTYLAGMSNRFNLDATFDGLEAERIIESERLNGRVAGGRISGTVALSSRNLRSIADLEGTVNATLSGSRAQDLPVIGSVVDVARLPTGSGGMIERGDIRVTVRRGVARVEEVTLAGPSFRLFAEGTVALASGRLALDVVADTTPARADRILAGLLLRRVIDYGTPVGWIEQANRFIAERAIYLRVTGTYRRPVVRVRPVEQLGQEAVRFFLNELASPLGGDRLDVRR